MLPSLKHKHLLVLESVICQSGSSGFGTDVCIPFSSTAKVAVLLLSQLKQTPCIQQGGTYTKVHCYQ